MHGVWNGGVVVLGRSRPCVCSDSLFVVLVSLLAGGDTVDRGGASYRGVYGLVYLRGGSLLMRVLEAVVW